MAATASSNTRAAVRCHCFRHDPSHAAQAAMATAHHSSTDVGRNRSTTMPAHTATSTISSGWYRGAAGRFSSVLGAAFCGEASGMRGIVAPPPGLHKRPGSRTPNA